MGSAGRRSAARLSVVAFRSTAEVQHRFRLSSAVRLSANRLSAARLPAAAYSSTFCCGSSLKLAYHRGMQRDSTLRYPVASVFLQIARTPHPTNPSIDRAYLGSPPLLCVLSPMAKATARRADLS